MQESKYPYIEYPGGIRQEQELKRMERYLEKESSKETNKLPYNINHGIDLVQKTLNTAFKGMFDASDTQNLKYHSLMALKATEFLSSLVITTDDFLHNSINDGKKLAHSDVMACGCLGPEEELPF